MPACCPRDAKRAPVGRLWKRPDARQDEAPPHAHLAPGRYLARHKMDEHAVWHPIRPVWLRACGQLKVLCGHEQHRGSRSGSSEADSRRASHRAAVRATHRTRPLVPIVMRTKGDERRAPTGARVTRGRVLLIVGGFYWKSRCNTPGAKARCILDTKAKLKQASLASKNIEVTRIR
jgi:hypothetical protein